MSITNSIESLILGVLMHGPDILNNCVTDTNTVNQYLERVNCEYLDYPAIQTNINSEWLIPDNYKKFDVEAYCLSLAISNNEKDRVIQELVLFKEHKMMELLQTIKYIVDTLRNNNIVWGVGRGSSVASYVLFLLGIHKINPLQYDIPITEFFK